jgi:hypothetical protein
VMTTPAFQRDAECPGGERGAAKHAIAAPRQSPTAGPLHYWAPPGTSRSGRNDGRRDRPIDRQLWLP